MDVTQEELENELIRVLLQGDHPALVALRQQYAAAQVVSREFSGVGFFTRYAIPENVPLVVPSSFAGGDVDLQLEGVQYGAGCVLFVRDGRLSMLECYTHVGPWPERIVVKSLTARVSPIQK
jgi:hypothetical protein